MPGHPKHHGTVASRKAGGRRIPLWTPRGPAVNAGPMAEDETDEQEEPGPPVRAGQGAARGEKSGPRGISATPHDGLFRALVSDPGRAAALIRDHLPERIVGLLADAPPVPLDGSFVDETLRSSQSDMLFKVELASGGPALVYVLVEHKSYADPGTPLQLAKYMVQIWMRHAQGRADRLRALPPIIPVVFSHGAARWSVAEGLGAMIAAEDPELVFLPGERFILRVLTALPTEELSRDAALRAGLIALTRRGIEDLELIVEGLAGEGTLRRQVFEYILLTYPEAEMDALRANLRAAGFDEMEGLVGTIAEALMERGEARGLKRGLERGLEQGLERGEARGLERGKAEGLEQGKAEGLTRLLERRFGPLPATARDRIAAAGPGELDAWLDRVLDADSLDAVLGKSDRH